MPKPPKGKATEAPHPKPISPAQDHSSDQTRKQGEPAAHSPSPPPDDASGDKSGKNAEVPSAAVWAAPHVGAAAATTLRDATVDTNYPQVSPSQAGPVLWVASEAVPLASTGGLGDVVGALPAVLRGLGWDVRVCLPYYRQQIKQPVSAALYEFDLEMAEPLRVVVRQLVDPANGVPTYLIDCPVLFDRLGLYVDAAGGFVDNPYRFGVFQLAVQELAGRLSPRPSIIHSHDWHASLLPALVRLPGEAAQKLHDVRTIFTIHNLQYQGDTERGIIDVLALPSESWSPDWAEHYGRFIPMKAGIMTADRVTTVSPTYAEELRGPIRGQGLDGAIRSRGHDMRGLINGIDDVAWNPATDKSLTANYSASELMGREACKRAVREELGLPDKPDRPLIGFIGRLVGDKGVDLIMDALPELLALDVQLVILGSGEKVLENRLRALEAAYSNKGFRGLIKFDQALSRRLYSAFDMLLVPSRLEPCGLVQLYALRYGSVPVVHAVGGLRDTVKEGENGFVFHEPTPRALADAVARAVAVWNTRSAWLSLQQYGMQQDWSWTRAAVPYDALYREVLSTPVRRLPLLRAAAPPAPPPPAPAPLKVEAASFRLMVQGPRALFAYWDLQTEGPFELVVEERPSGVIFTAAADLPAKGERWIGALPDQAYRALLRRQGHVQALSNAVVTPLETPPPPQTPQPSWLESAVDVGVFEEDAHGQRWASVFREAATFSSTTDGEFEPQWSEGPLGTPPTFGDHRSLRVGEAGVSIPPKAFALAAPLIISSHPASDSVGLHVPAKEVSLGSVSYPSATTTRYASGGMIHPDSPVPPGPRSLNMRDVRFRPTGEPVSGTAGLPTSAGLATGGKKP